MKETRIYYKTSYGSIIHSDKLKTAYFYLFGVDPNSKELKHFAYTCRGIVGTVKNPTVKYLVMQGEKVEAIKLYHETKGVSLPEAKHYVDKLAEELKES